MLSPVTHMFITSGTKRTILRSDGSLNDWNMMPLSPARIQVLSSQPVRTKRGEKLTRKRSGLPLPLTRSNRATLPVTSAKITCLEYASMYGMIIGSLVEPTVRIGPVLSTLS